MRVAILDHHGKALNLANSLAHAGFDLAPDASIYNYEVLLVDSDHPQAAPQPVKHQVVKEAVKRGIPVVLYPHGAMPDLDYDGIRKFAVPVSLQLLHGEGHAEVYRRCGLRHRFEVIGWTYGPQVTCPPAPVDTEAQPGCVPGLDRHLLFAPIHPWANGVDILPHHKALNEAAYHQFVNHPAPRKTVRMYGADQPNGVRHRYPGIDYQQSDLGPGVWLIDQADAVISYGTFAYQALARGKPVVMIHPYPSTTSDDGTVEARHFDEYADYVRYPAAIGDGDLDDLFRLDVSEWKRLFVGEPLNIEKLSGLLHSLRPNRATRRRLAKVA